MSRMKADVYLSARSKAVPIWRHLQTDVIIIILRDNVSLVVGARCTLALTTKTRMTSGRLRMAAGRRMSTGGRASRAGAPNAVPSCTTTAPGTTSIVTSTMNSTSSARSPS